MTRAEAAQAAALRASKVNRAAVARAGKAEKERLRPPYQFADADNERTAHPSKIRKVKPWSGHNNGGMTYGALDLRTREGAFCEHIRTTLLEQLGPNPTPAQQLMCQLAAVKALRCELLVQVLFADQNIKDVREYHLLAWSNGLRRDLQALGLLAPPVAEASLDAYQLARIKYGPTVDAAG